MSDLPSEVEASTEDGGPVEGDGLLEVDVDTFVSKAIAVVFGQDDA